MPLLLCAAKERVFADTKGRIVVCPLPVEERFRMPIEAGEYRLIQVAPKRGWFLGRRRGQPAGGTRDPKPQPRI